ncbi:MAG TPA: hypothetical protein VGN52_14715 [Burkholderiales bacterium]
MTDTPESEECPADQTQVARVAGTVVGVLIGLPVLALLFIFAPFGVALAPMLLLSPLIMGALSPSDGSCLPLICRWAFVTYVVWAVFSIFSFNMLYPLALPALLPMLFERYVQFLPFMGPPLGYALMISALVCACVLPFVPPRSRRWGAPFLFNVLLLTSTLAFAEGRRYLLMQEDLRLHTPSCVDTETFLSSLAAGWEDFQFHIHGVIVEDGVTYLWSYRKMRFMPQPHLQGWSCMPLPVTP